MKRSAKTHLFQKLISLSLHTHFVEDVAKAVHVKRGHTGDAFQTESLRTVTRLDTKEEASGSADNCTAFPGEAVGNIYMDYAVCYG